MAETILQTIAEYARLRVKEAKRSIPLEEMKQKAFADISIHYLYAEIDFIAFH